MDELLHLVRSSSSILVRRRGPTRNNSSCRRLYSKQYRSTDVCVSKNKGVLDIFTWLSWYGQESLVLFLLLLESAGACLGAKQGAIFNVLSILKFCSRTTKGFDYRISPG